MLFDLRLHHRNDRAESVFTGCHSKEVFTFPIVRRPDSYQLFPEWSYDFVDMPLFYPTETPTIYMYFASATLVAMDVGSRTFNVIAVAWYARQALLTVLRVAQWATRHCDFHDNRIVRL